MDTLIHAVLQATIVSKCVLVLLLFMSLASWAFMFAKYLALRSAKVRVLSGLHGAERAQELRDILRLVARDSSSPLYNITSGAIDEFNRLSRTGDIERLASENVRRALHFGIAGEIARLKSSLACHSSQYGALHRAFRNGVGYHAILHGHCPDEKRFPCHCCPGHSRSPCCHSGRPFCGYPCCVRLQRLQGQAFRNRGALHQLRGTSAQSPAAGKQPSSRRPELCAGGIGHGSFR